jgi:hypothetical protein
LIVAPGPNNSSVALPRELAQRSTGAIVTRSEIIAAMLRSALEVQPRLHRESVEPGVYERHLAAKLEHMLLHTDPEMDIPSCADFSHLGEGCCPVCHDEYPDEMALIETECGGRAWLCCALDRALNPLKHAAMEQSPDWQELVRVFSPDAFGD